MRNLLHYFINYFSCFNGMARALSSKYCCGISSVWRQSIIGWIAHWIRSNYWTKYNKYGNNRMKTKFTDNAVTDFGFTKVSAQEKTQRVADVFRSVAPKYDLMNDVMSFGLHRLWKRFTIAQSGVRQGQFVLDIAGGTGDLAREFAKRVGAKGLVVLADINEKMLEQG